jgi:hypothetical protein
VGESHRLREWFAIEIASDQRARPFAGQRRAVGLVQYHPDLRRRFLRPQLRGLGILGLKLSSGILPGRGPFAKSNASSSSASKAKEHPAGERTVSLP